jgi:hypothetical protein
LLRWIIRMDAILLRQFKLAFDSLTADTFAPRSHVRAGGKYPTAALLEVS